MRRNIIHRLEEKQHVVIGIRQNPNDKTYIYRNVLIYDKETKKVKYIHKSINHINPATGEAVPNRRKDDAASCGFPRWLKTHFNVCVLFRQRRCSAVPSQPMSADVSVAFPSLAGAQAGQWTPSEDYACWCKPSEKHLCNEYIDMKRLRIHSDAAMESRIFILFIALLITTWLK